MATLTPTLVDADGAAEPATTAANNGDLFVNTGAEYLIATTGGAQRVITVATPYTLPNGLAATARTITVPANSYVIAGPFPPVYHNNGSGQVVLTYDTTAGITVGVIKTQQL